MQLLPTLIRRRIHKLVPSVLEEFSVIAKDHVKIVVRWAPVEEQERRAVRL